MSVYGHDDDPWVYLYSTVLKFSFGPYLDALNVITQSLFAVGIFCGLSKPNSFSEYLEQFVKDLQNVLSNCIICNDKQFEVHAFSFICDAPDRAYIKQTKAFNGYSGCDKCFQEDVWRNTMTYPETKVRHSGQTPVSLTWLIRNISLARALYLV